MPQVLSVDQIKRVACLELSGLRLANVLPADLFERAKIGTLGTEIFDIGGEPLFRRLPIVRGRQSSGYADIAVNDVLGEPLLGVSISREWNEASIVEEGTAAAKKGRRGFAFDKVRFVAYSYPKLALQFLKGDQEALMLELGSWSEVPPAQKTERKPMEPGNFERWSLVNELPATAKRAGAKNFAKRLQSWQAPQMQRIDTTLISDSVFKPGDIVLKLVDSRELHYSKRDTDHVPCYELRGQMTTVWCVAASTEMLLNFYRYTYSQVRLAAELGLGTLASPNGLPYARVGDVVTVIENLTSNSLDATMITGPSFADFQGQIKENRPMISFVPGHSRTVAGYIRYVLSLPGTTPFRGLLVYDPWDWGPLPKHGVITRWENFATQTYQFAYSAVIKEI
jgi:hypothetical protein